MSHHVCASLCFIVGKSLWFTPPLFGHVHLEEQWHLDAFNIVTILHKMCLFGLNLQ